MIKNQKQMFIVIGAFVLTLLLGTTAYAFFNYTRTGASNVIKTGRIAFNADQSAQVTLSDLFPITVGDNETVTASTPGVGSLSIHVTGDTSYEEGIEYLIKAINVTGDNGTNLPISIAISYEANTGKTIGTPDDSYFTNRGGNSSVYKVLSNDTISEGKELVVGYIAPDNNGTGIDGTLTILVYLDARNIVITDTYPEGIVREVKEAGYTSAACETALAGVTGASTYCATASSLQTAINNGSLTDAQMTLLVNAGLVDEYTDGTTDTWVGDRTVLTTSEWNSLQASGVSFQVKVEANEGTWVTAPVASAPTIDTCQGCVYTYTTTTLSAGNNGTVMQASDYDEDYRNVITETRKHFLGLKLDDNTHQITDVYACGIKGEDPNNGTPFCLMSAISGDAFNTNFATVNNLWNNTCTAYSMGGTRYCLGAVSVSIVSNQQTTKVGIGTEDVTYGTMNMTDYCKVEYSSSATCIES